MTAPGAPSYATVLAARDELIDVSGVESAAIMPPDGGGYDRRLSLVLAPGYDRVPPRVLRGLASRDLGIVDVSPQGSQYVVTAE